MEETAVKIWRILDILKLSENLLREKNIEKPRLNAELLLCDTLQTERIRLYLDFEKPLTESELNDFRSKIKRRINHEPLQYITGKTEFYELKFTVNPAVLIPRQETEILVEKTLEVINSCNPNPKILEIGTGSGCISIALAANCDCSIDAIDTSSDAIVTAKLNSANNNTTGRINFQTKNILTDFKNFDNYEIVVSNPPYIPLKDMSGLQNEVKDYEPASALTDNSDGLTFYRKIIELAKNTSSEVKVLLEIGDNYKINVDNLLKENSINDFSFYKDLIGIDRVLYFEMKNN